MKSAFPFLVILSFSFISCKKDYQCVCTNSNTGTVSRGDKMSAGPFTKAATEETCKKNNDLSGGGLKDCHLEDYK
jgi:hypothetical protein